MHPVRKAGILAALLVAFAAPLLAQQRQQQAARPPARPGPLVRADGVINWNRYYNTTETHAILRELARRFPRLTQLVSIGKSFKGADLMVMEITNEETGPASDKPALYLDGGIHAGELTGSAVALYLASHLIQNYGKDPQITRLLDTRAFYIRPKFNPDGADIALSQDAQLRSSVRPWDDDGDGIADEDGADDLNRDGRITQLRVPDRNGDWKLHPADPRLLIRRSPDDSTGRFYFVTTEGIDNDRDGRFNEDGIGGIDMNRNFPRHWEREHIQPGAGPFPLSEPETYATVKFITEHANIASIVHGHTSGGFVYRLPSSSDPATFDAKDLAVIEELGRFYTESTGRPVQPSATHATDHRYGTLIGWAYEDRGIIGWVPEYAPPHGWISDAGADSVVSELEAIRFNDEKLGGRYFTPWARYAHPQLGEVEVGGWYARFWQQNPPAEYLEAECKVQVPWILSLLEKTPLLDVAPRVSGAAGGRVRIDVTITNNGWLPTNLTRQGAAGRSAANGAVISQVVAPPVATIQVAGGELVSAAQLVVGHLAGTNAIAPGGTERSRTVTFIVRKTAPELKVTVRVLGGPAGNPSTNQIVYR